MARLQIDERREEGFDTEARRGGPRVGQRPPWRTSAVPAEFTLACARRFAASTDMARRVHRLGRLGSRQGGAARSFGEPGFTQTIGQDFP
jgi:hypothetical protein